MTQDSLLSDELLHHLMAVGQVDILVGVPTLNNAATVRAVVKAVHTAFGTDFLRLRTVLINSDGGSTDGTPEIVRGLSAVDGETLTVSHGLRTIHRVSAPYHGIPGKGNALRQILAAADLTQARAVAVLDPDVVSVTPEWVAALIRPVLEQGFDYVAPVYARHPLDGPLVTQLIRPLIRAAYGWQVTEPLAAEFGCSTRFLSHCLEQDIWSDDLAQSSIDLWVTTTALAGGFRCCQAALGPRLLSPGGHRPGLQDVFTQIVGAAFICLDRDAAYWLGRPASEALPMQGRPPTEGSERPGTDGGRLTQSFCADLRDLQSVLAPILDERVLAALNRIADVDCERLRYPDDLWAATVYDFLIAHHRGVMRREHIAQALMPLYLGRAGSFLLQHAATSAAEAAEALDALCVQFERVKPDVIARWSEASPR